MAKYRIRIDRAVAPWMLVRGDDRFGSVHPLPGAQALSRELGGRVIAFAVQTTASVELIEHWDKGALIRKLEYSFDQGGWLADEGVQQPWEATYFFADGESTADGDIWPLNLGDELSDEDIARYERARAKRDASGIMDLLSGGSTSPFVRVCAHFGVDSGTFAAHYETPPNWKLRLAVAATAVVIVGGFLLGLIFR